MAQIDVHCHVRLLSASDFEEKRTMKIVGGGNIVELGIKDELRHVSDGDEHWQDSVVLCWWDLQNHVGGYHRIGLHPHLPQGPQAHLSNNFFAKDCIYKRCEFIPLSRENNSQTSFDCGDGTCVFEFTDHAIWTFDQAEVSGQLHIHDSHPPIDAYPKKGQLAEKITAGHLEVGGCVSGSITFNGRQYNINGFAFRDHGWGKRHWDVFVNHRWIAASFGPKLTVLAVSVHTTDDTITTIGCVIRDGELIYADKVDIVTYVECDGITHRGGYLDLELSTGEALHFDIKPLQKGVVSWMAGQMATIDTMCEIKCGDLIGICDFEISTNPTRGRERPRAAINGLTEDGLYKL